MKIPQSHSIASGESTYRSSRWSVPTGRSRRWVSSSQLCRGGGRPFIIQGLWLNLESNHVARGNEENILGKAGRANHWSPFWRWSALSWRWGHVMSGKWRSRRFGNNEGRRFLCPWRSCAKRLSGSRTTRMQRWLMYCFRSPDRLSERRR